MPIFILYLFYIVFPCANMSGKGVYSHVLPAIYIFVAPKIGVSL